MNEVSIREWGRAKQTQHNRRWTRESQGGAHHTPLRIEIDEPRRGTAFGIDIPQSEISLLLAPKKERVKLFLLRNSSGVSIQSIYLLVKRNLRGCGHSSPSCILVIGEGSRSPPGCSLLNAS